MLQLLLQLQLGPSTPTAASVHGLRMQSLYQAHVADQTNAYKWWCLLVVLLFMPAHTTA